MSNFSRRKSKNKPVFLNDGWCFAIVNGRLAEIFFKREIGIWGHCYVDQEKHTKTEQRMIDADIKKRRFIYRKGRYKDKLSGFTFRTPNCYKVFPRMNRVKGRPYS